MSTESVLCSVEAGHARVTLNRPEFHNPLSDGVMSRLAAVFADLRADPTVRVVTIRGAGPSFCAGADLKMFLRVLDDPAALTAFIRSTKTVFTAIERFPHPVIAVVHGFVLAGGLELMLACDLAIATEDAMIGDQHSAYGILPGGGSTVRLPRRIGQQRALELIYTGRRLTGREAEAYGLVLRAVPREQIEETLEGILTPLRQRSRPLLATIKSAVTTSVESPKELALEREQLLVTKFNAANADSAQGAQAFAARKDRK